MLAGGKPQLEDAKGFELLKLSLVGQDIEIRLTKRKKDRTSAANRYYWGVIIPMLAEFCGMTREETHDALKHKLLIDRTDEGLPRVRSTCSLTTEEFSRYLDGCIQLAGEIGLIIPDPK